MYDTIFNLALRANAMALYRRNTEVGLAAHLLALFVGVSARFAPSAMLRRLVVAVAWRDPVKRRVDANRGGGDSFGRRDRRSVQRHANYSHEKKEYTEDDRWRIV